MSSPSQPPRLPPAEELHRRAREALAQGRFDLAEEALARDELDLITLVENLRIYQAELEIQNQELQESRAQVEHALARFSSFFATLPLAELIVDAKGLILEVNRTAELLFELGRDHLRQHFFARLVGEADREAVIDAFSAAWEAQRADLIEIPFRTALGRDFIGDLHIASLPGEPGAPHQFVCAVVDRTEAVHQRQVLHDFAEGLRESRAELAERIKELACLYDVVKLLSQPDAEIGPTLQQIAERLPAAMLVPELAQASIRWCEQVFATAGVEACEPFHEVPFAYPEGGLGWLRVGYRAPAAGGRTPAFLPEELALLEAVADHIANFLRRRAAEAALVESREGYRILADYSPDWEYWLGPDGRYLYISPACEPISGYPPRPFGKTPGYSGG